MFTGLIEEVGRVEAARAAGDGRDIVITAREVLSDLRTGHSVAVDGVCQTVVAVTESGFRVHAIASTLSRTTLGEFAPGRAVNLERPLAAGDRFGGHFVQGHVDAVGRIVSVRRREEMVLVDFTLPESVRDYTVRHGSITLDGVSLTINDLAADGNAQVALIPYTYEHTNLARLTEGSRVNIEADLIGKYVARALAGYERALGVGDVPPDPLKDDGGSDA